MISSDGFLVIGYGNSLRSDDGVGVRVAEAVEAMRLPKVRTLACQQLSPEHAEPISQAGTVIFVDAAVDSPNIVRLRKLEPGDSCQLVSHSADPSTMLALARDVFGHAPQAWWLTIPAVNLDFCEELSPETRRGFDNALRAIQQICALRQGSESRRRWVYERAHRPAQGHVGERADELFQGGEESLVGQMAWQTWVKRASRSRVGRLSGHSNR